MRHLLAVPLLGLFASGCSVVESTEPVAAPASQYQKDLGPYHRDATMIDAESQRGGAAVRTSERRHVLHYRSTNHVGDFITSDINDEPSDISSIVEPIPVSEALATVSKIDKQDVKKNPLAGKTLPAANGYSLYELYRWERYCQGNPDGKDVKFIIKAGGHDKLPAHLVGKCHPKKIL